MGELCLVEETEAHVVVRLLLLLSRSSLSSRGSSLGGGGSSSSCSGGEGLRVGEDLLDLKRSSQHTVPNKCIGVRHQVNRVKYSVNNRPKTFSIFSVYIFVTSRTG